MHIYIDDNEDAFRGWNIHRKHLECCCVFMRLPVFLVCLSSRGLQQVILSKNLINSLVVEHGSSALLIW